MAAVGLAPGSVEESEGRNFVGPSGVVLRTVLQESGIDPSYVSYMNLTRCRPDDDDFDSPQWRAAAKACGFYLRSDIPAGIPILALGSGPAQRFLGDAKASAVRLRGMWHRSSNGEQVYVARHPAAVLRERNPSRRALLEAEFRADIARMAPRVLGTERLPLVTITVLDEPGVAAAFLRRTVRVHPGPWAFDIETFDGEAFPSRKDVATDPCHPDFRVRGVALALDGGTGAWVELAGREYHKGLRSALTEAFGSDADKWAFNGHFDEEGLVYGGRWVPAVRSRTGDGMLALIALGDTSPRPNTLARGIVDVLGEPQHWEGFDKTKVRDAPLAAVAEGAVRDACATWRLCQVLHERLKVGKYL